MVDVEDQLEISMSRENATSIMCPRDEDEEIDAREKKRPNTLSREDERIKYNRQKSNVRCTTDPCRKGKVFSSTLDLKPQQAETRLENGGKQSDGYDPANKVGNFEQKPSFGADILKPVDENKSENFLPSLPGRGCDMLPGVKGFGLPGNVTNPEFLPSPLWYPPYPMPQSYPGIDPLHFFIDLRVSGHIWDRKLSERQLPFKGKHCSAFSVPQSKEYNSNRPLNLTRDEACMSRSSEENLRGTNYILRHLTRTYRDISQARKAARSETSTSESEDSSKDVDNITIPSHKPSHVARSYFNINSYSVTDKKGFNQILSFVSLFNFATTVKTIIKKKKRITSELIMISDNAKLQDHFTFIAPIDFHHSAVQLREHDDIIRSDSLNRTYHIIKLVRVACGETQIQIPRRLLIRNRKALDYIEKWRRRSVITHSGNSDKSQKVLTSSEDDTGSSPIPYFLPPVKYSRQLFSYLRVFLRSILYYTVERGRRKGKL
ncbi:hypothetical protein WN51_11081 [Melipona quadrifasciata]|uniref:Uncharacterized protein n=1 Tax=Melipona quadrifasciata TaxID=166423 RepID=A0A0M9A3X9_9HYME|nr:hypothetical protein WN51_11081 [Melipona quadrifasciata]